MDLTHDTVRSIADLAKLDLSEDEVATFAAQLSDILGYFEHLQRADTSQVEATASVLPLRNVLRADEPGPPLPTDQVTANAPDSQDDQFRVSAVLDE